MDLYLAVDIGATYTRIGVGTRDGLIDKVKYRTPRRGDEYSIARRIYEVFREKYGRYMDELRGIGVASIGPLDIRRGRVVNTPNLPIHSFELLEPLREYFEKPVYVLNDAVAGVYGEKVFGDGRRYDNIVYVTLSSGVGGGVIVDGELLIGKSGNAHEIGHIVVKYDSRIRCGCGGYGHWEAYAGGSNIPRLAEVLAGESEESPGSTAWSKALQGELSAKELFYYYRSGDRFAAKVVDEIISACIAGFSSIINVYDPELVTIGGSVFLNNVDILYEPIATGVDKHIVTDKPFIKPTMLGEDVVLYGALALAVKPPGKLLELQG